MNVEVKPGIWLNFPVPNGWRLDHDPAKQTVVVHDGAKRRATFEYDFAEAHNMSGVFLRGHVLVQGNGQGKRCNAQTALYDLATGWGALR
jgi:hypothetical protein